MSLRAADIDEIQSEEKPSTISAGHYPLAMACAGQVMRVVCFASGQRLQKKLRDLGIHVGAEIRILKNDLDCPLLLAVGDSRVAVGQGMASKIMAAPCASTNV